MTVDTEGFPTEENRSGTGYYWTPHERWYLCDYCGWIFPESEIRKEAHTGLRACRLDYNDPTEHDEALIARRNQILFTRNEEWEGREDE